MVRAQDAGQTPAPNAATVARNRLTWTSYLLVIGRLVVACTRVPGSSTPQSSAHLPAKTPTLFGVSSKEFSRPGITSILNRNCGTQNEWMTSGDLSRKRVFSSTGSHSVGAWSGVPMS